MRRLEAPAVKIARGRGNRAEPKFHGGECGVYLGSSGVRASVLAHQPSMSSGCAVIARMDTAAGGCLICIAPYLLAADSGQFQPPHAHNVRVSPEATTSAH